MKANHDTAGEYTARRAINDLAEILETAALDIEADGEMAPKARRLLSKRLRPGGALHPAYVLQHAGYTTEEQRAVLSKAIAITGLIQPRRKGMDQVKPSIDRGGTTPTRLRATAERLRAAWRLIDDAGDSADDRPKPRNATPEVERAAMLYKQATEYDPALRTDKQVYDHLAETLEPEHLPPSLGAFQASLKRARKAGLLEPKRSPRHQGGATSKSVIRADQK